jgi:hypothetical protein
LTVSRVLQLVCRHALWMVLFTLPAVLLWWHVWTGHPSTTLTCACGDPAQQVWFMAWPAWALAHSANLFFSNAVNVPYGANLLSNTSGTLVSVVLSPVTWLWGPVASTNVALTLAPGLSAWGCWLAIRRFVTWKPGAVPAALVYGYSAAIVSSLIFAHVSVTLLVIPPLLLATLHEIFVRQEHAAVHDGVALAALLIVQFLISPEVLVMCALLAAIGLVAAALVGWRAIAARLPHALRASLIGLGASGAVIAYPAWYGIAGKQSVTGVLFAIAPLSGVVVTGYMSPGPFETFAGSYVRFGGYFGRIGPRPNYLGWGVAIGSLWSLVVACRRPMVWLLLLLTAVTVWLSLGSYVVTGPHWLEHLWLPWRHLATVPVFKEILPDQFAPFVTLFLAFLLAIGLDSAHALIGRLRRLPAWATRTLGGALTIVVGVGVLVPVFITYDLPLHVRPTAIPVWMSDRAPELPAHTVLLTVPFAVSGSTAPMLWQAVDQMHFRLAGAALKTPNAQGGPVNQGAPGSARRILSDLTIFGTAEPKGTPLQYAAVRGAMRSWDVNEVVIDGLSRDPVYAAGFLTAALGLAPRVDHDAWVWKIPSGGLDTPPVTNTSLTLCRAAAWGSTSGHRPLAIVRCMLQNTPQS